MPAVPPFGAAAPTNFTFVGGSTSSSLGVTLPSGIASDNTYIAIGGRTTSFGVTPSGWTGIGRDMHYKVLSAADSSVSVQTNAVQVWRANGPISSVTAVATSGGESGNGDMAAQTILGAEFLGVPGIAFSIASSSGNINPFSVSPSATQTTGLNTPVAIAARVITGTPGDTIFDMDDEGSNNRLVSNGIWVT